MALELRQWIASFAIHGGRERISNAINVPRDSRKDCDPQIFDFQIRPAQSRCGMIIW